MPTHTASLTLRSTPQAITAMNPSVTQSSYIKHSPKPMPWSQTPPFSRVPDPSNGTGQLTQHPAVALDQTVARWLREGAPRVNSRSHSDPATRPFIPAALFSFFDGAISLPQCSQLIAQHLASSTSHARTAAPHGGCPQIYTNTSNYGSRRLLQNLPPPTSFIGHHSTSS